MGEVVGLVVSETVTVTVAGGEVLGVEGGEMAIG